jgi:hypothetical protein
VVTREKAKSELIDSPSPLLTPLSARGPAPSRDPGIRHVSFGPEPSHLSQSASTSTICCKTYLFSRNTTLSRSPKDITVLATYDVRLSSTPNNIHPREPQRWRGRLIQRGVAASGSSHQTRALNAARNEQRQVDFRHARQSCELTSSVASAMAILHAVDAHPRRALSVFTKSQSGNRRSICEPKSSNFEANNDKANASLQLWYRPTYQSKSSSNCEMGKHWRPSHTSWTMRPRGRQARVVM